MKKSLWLLELAGQTTGRLILFYAADEIEAETRASDYELDHNAKRRDLRQFKHGFRVVEFEMPGTIDTFDDERRD